jgi:hypothetical protein
MATRQYPSYCVEILGQGNAREPLIMTLYTEKLSEPCRHWWYAKRVTPEVLQDIHPPRLQSVGE